MIRSIANIVSKRNFSVLNEFTYKQVIPDKEEKPKPHEIAEEEEKELNKDYWKEKVSSFENYDGKNMNKKYDVEKMKWTTSIS